MWGGGGWCMEVGMGKYHQEEVADRGCILECGH